MPAETGRERLHAVTRRGARGCPGRTAVPRQGPRRRDPSTAASAMSATSGTSCWCAARTSATRPRGGDAPAGEREAAQHRLRIVGIIDGGEQRQRVLDLALLKETATTGNLVRHTALTQRAHRGLHVDVLTEEPRDVCGPSPSRQSGRAHSRATAIASLRSSGARHTSTAAPDPRSAISCLSIRVAGLATAITARDAATIWSVLR